MSTHDKLTTVMLFTSPIPSNPSTAIIDETLRAVRFWLPESPVFILADGVRTELEHRRAAYEMYLNKLEDRCMRDVWIFRHSAHRHQAAMMKGILGQIKTPLTVFQEHDLPLRTDVGIDWPLISEAIMTGQADSVRFMLTDSIHPEHMYLMLGMLRGSPLMKTRQLSGWTHIAATDYFRRLFKDFDSRAKIMFERVAGRIIEAHPWEDFKLTSYIPDPAAARRIYHTHGRGGVNGEPDDKTFVETECYPPK